MSDAIILTNQELAGIELAAMKRPTKDGSMAPRIVRCLLEHLSSVYGIDPGFITEDMANEESKRKAKEDRQRSKRGGRLGRKTSRGLSDDF